VSSWWTAGRLRWGRISPPFAYYDGTEESPDGRHKSWTLVHVPTKRIIATLRGAGQVKALAAELVAALLREDRELVAGVVERHRREST